MISADDAVADDQRARIVDTPPDAVPALSSQNTKERIHGIGTKFPLTVLLVSVSVPELLTPAPEVALPLRIVSFERVTWAVVLEILTTVPTPPPSIIVVLAPEPITFTIMLMVRFSV